MLVIDWKTYRDRDRKLGGEGELDRFEGPNIVIYASRFIGEKIRSYAFEHRLPIYEVFQETILPGLKKSGDEWVSPKELIHIAMQCGPYDHHAYAEAIVILYFALGLNPGNVRKKILQLFKEGGFDIRATDHITQSDIGNAEFYLGLPAGTLRDMQT